MKVKSTSASCAPGSASVYMSCEHDKVAVEFRYDNYGEGRNDIAEFRTESRATADGVEMRKTDRYDMTGRRLTEAPDWSQVFTAEFYAELDATALLFLGDINAEEDKRRRHFPAENTTAANN